MGFRRDQRFASVENLRKDLRRVARACQVGVEDELAAHDPDGADVIFYILANSPMRPVGLRCRALQLPIGIAWLPFDVGEQDQAMEALRGRAEMHVEDVAIGVENDPADIRGSRRGTGKDVGRREKPLSPTIDRTIGAAQVIRHREIEAVPDFR